MTSSTIGVEVGAKGSGVGLGEGAVVESGIDGVAGVNATADGVGGKAGVGRRVENSVSQTQVAIHDAPMASRRDDAVNPVGLWLRHGAGFPQVVQNVSCMACQQPCAGP